MVNFLHRLLSVSALGSSFRWKVVIVVLYLYLSARRVCGYTPQFTRLKKIRLSFADQAFDFYIDRQLDFDVLRDTFVLEEYAITSTENVNVIFDIGSNIGTTVIYFALTHPTAKIFAFEADPDTSKRFKINTAVFSDRIVFIEKAVYSKDNTFVEFHSSPTIHWSSSIVERPGTISLSIPTITLDRVIEDFAIEHVDLIKFDIEGGEYDAFVHFTHFNKVNMLVGEIHPEVLPVSVDEFLRLFRDFKVVKRVDNDNIVVTLKHTDTTQ